MKKQLAKSNKQNEDLNLILLKFRDDDFENCLKTLNRIIAKNNIKTFHLYKAMCGLNLHNFNLQEFFEQVNNLSINHLESYEQYDLYYTLKKHIHPNNSFLGLTYESSFSYFKGLYKFLTSQTEEFKSSVLVLMTQIFCWENLKEPKKNDRDVKLLAYSVGYRPYMISDFEILLNLFYSNSIDENIIKLFIEEIKTLFINTLKHYQQETQNDFDVFLSGSDEIKEINVLYRISCFKYLNNFDKIITLLSHFEKKMDIDFKIDEFKKNINTVIDQNLIIEQRLKNKQKEIELKSGCFVATATMGNYNHPAVLELRNFRDSYILTKKWGETFVKIYYKYGKITAGTIEKSYILKKISFIFIIMPLLFLSRMLNR